MSKFWSDPARLATLKECLACVITDVNESYVGVKPPNSIQVFIAAIARNATFCFEVFDGESFRSRMRFSGMPQRKDAADPATGALAYASLEGVKKKMADVVDLILSSGAKFTRLMLRLDRHKHQIVGKLMCKGGAADVACVKDDKGALWAYTMEVDSMAKNDVFETFADWLEAGSQGRAPGGTWNGFLTLGKVSMQ